MMILIVVLLLQREQAFATVVTIFPVIVPGAWCLIALAKLRLLAASGLTSHGLVSSLNNDLACYQHRPNHGIRSQLGSGEFLELFGLTPPLHRHHPRQVPHQRPHPLLPLPRHILPPWAWSGPTLSPLRWPITSFCARSFCGSSRSCFTTWCCRRRRPRRWRHCSRFCGCGRPMSGSFSMSPSMSGQRRGIQPWVPCVLLQRDTG